MTTEEMIAAARATLAHYGYASEQTQVSDWLTRIMVTPGREGFTAPVGTAIVDALIDTAAGTITIASRAMHLEADLSVFTPITLAVVLIIPYGPTN